MKYYCVVVFLIVAYTTVLAQDTLQKGKFVFFELAGTGGLGSINYEKNFRLTPKARYSFRAGFSLAPIDRNNGIVLIFPLMVNAIKGKASNKMEVGLGQTISITTKGKFFPMGIGALGYRYEPENKKWFMRFTYTPLISYIIDLQVQHWGGISIGYRLNN